MFPLAEISDGVLTALITAVVAVIGIGVPAWVQLKQLNAKMEQARLEAAVASAVTVKKVDDTHDLINSRLTDMLKAAKAAADAAGFARGIIEERERQTAHRDAKAEGVTLGKAQEKSDESMRQRVPYGGNAPEASVIKIEGPVAVKPHVEPPSAGEAK